MSRVTPVAPVRVTLVPGTTAPEGSLTTPATWPVVDVCACKIPVIIMTAPHTQTLRKLVLSMVSPFWPSLRVPRCTCFSGVNENYLFNRLFVAHAQVSLGAEQLFEQEISEELQIDTGVGQSRVNPFWKGRLGVAKQRSCIGP